MWGFSLEDLERFAKLVAAKAIAELESQELVEYEHKAYTMPPQPEQKTSADDFFKTIADRNPKPFSPSQRTWAGLTDEEKHKTWYEMQNIMGWYSFQEIVQAIEAKLKEKNT
jgi:hypothetical protein